MRSFNCKIQDSLRLLNGYKPKPQGYWLKLEDRQRTQKNAIIISAAIMNALEKNMVSLALFKKVS